jgi:D-serine deaminase-like pyridoxal phosphate-dependent protein
MMHSPRDFRDEVAMLLGEVDEAIIDRVLDSGASLDEITEAIGDLDARLAEPQHVPSTARVAEVREVLRALIDCDAQPHRFPLQAAPDRSATSW